MVALTPVAGGFHVARSSRHLLPLMCPSRPLALSYLRKLTLLQIRAWCWRPMRDKITTRQLRECRSWDDRSVDSSSRNPGVGGFEQDTRAYHGAKLLPERPQGYISGSCFEDCRDGCTLDSRSHLDTASSMPMRSKGWTDSSIKCIVASEGCRSWLCRREG